MRRDEAAWPTSVLRDAHPAFAVSAPQDEECLGMASKKFLILRSPPLRDAACGGSSGLGRRLEGRTVSIRRLRLSSQRPYRLTAQALSIRASALAKPASA